MLCYVVRPDKEVAFHPHVCDLDLIQKMTDWGTNLAIRTGTGKSAIVFAAEQMGDNKMEFTADEQVVMTKILQYLVYRLARTHVDVGKPHTFSHWALERPLSYFMLHRLGALTKPDRYESVVRFIGGFFHQGVIDSQGSNIVDALGDAFFCECRAMREKTEFDDIIDEAGNVVDDDFDDGAATGREDYSEAQRSQAKDRSEKEKEREKAIQREGPAYKLNYKNLEPDLGVAGVGELLLDSFVADLSEGWGDSGDVKLWWQDGARGTAQTLLNIINVAIVAKEQAEYYRLRDLEYANEMLELARHAELHAAGVIEYFDNFDEHSEGAMFGRTIRRLVCSDNKLVELSRSKMGKQKGGLSQTSHLITSQLGELALTRAVEGELRFFMSKPELHWTLKSQFYGELGSLLLLGEGRRHMRLGSGVDLVPFFQTLFLVGFIARRKREAPRPQQRRRRPVNPDV